MRTAGLTMNDVWAHRVLRDAGVETHRNDQLPAELGVHVESVDLKHHGPEENYRPYLHLTGELRSIRPAQVLPFGITQVTFSPGRGEPVDVYYEFDDEQLVRLARKGFFTRAFTVPEQITDIEWELPAVVDTLVLAPVGTDAPDDHPVVFTHVHALGNLEIDLESSGYDLADYFADHSPTRVPRQPAVAVDERALQARSAAINSLFAGEEVELFTPEQVTVRAAAASKQPPTSVDGPLQRAEAEVAAEAAALQAEREQSAGTPENIYRQRVAVALAEETQDGTDDVTRSTDPGDTVPTTRPAGGLDVDLGELAEDAEPRARGTARATGVPHTVERRTAPVARRAAVLDFDEGGTPDLDR